MTEKNHITEINFEAGDHAMPQDSPRPEPAETLTSHDALPPLHTSTRLISFLSFPYQSAK